MSLKVRPFRGKFEVDIHFYLPDGTRVRERRVAPGRTRSAALRWGEALQRELLLRAVASDALEAAPEPEAPDVPTLAEFAPRFIDGYARANRLKPSGISSKQSVLRNHLIPLLGRKRLEEIGNEDVQGIKMKLAKAQPATVNNILCVLSKLLKVAIEWGVIEKMPCTIKLLKRVHPEMRFHDFHEYERLVAAARRVDPRAYVIVLLGGEAGLRCGEMIGLEWTDIDQERRQLRVARSVWNRHVSTPKSGKPRIIPMTTRLAAALAAHRHLRSRRVLCHRTGRFLNQHDVQRQVERAERLANLDHLGVHALRHTFCSHLAMRGAPAKAVQELAGHSELITTQRYMHLSPAAKESAIRLLEPDQPPAPAVALVDAVELYPTIARRTSESATSA
ncbi:MAG: tyrosine-type recombinase/integrase [Candidatus Eiseniibacteriota bacterium]